MEAIVDKKTGSVSIRLSRVLELLEGFGTGAARDFADIAGKVLLSEGDPAFEFYSRRIWPRLRGLVPLLFFRESMGKFFLGVVGSKSRREAAGLTDEDAETLRSMFGAGCNPGTALDTLFLTIGELDFSPATAARLRPLTLVDRRNERIPADCLAGEMRVSYIISVLESCRSMLTDPSYLDAVVEQLARAPNGYVSAQAVVAMLNRAYGDPAAVSVDDILVVRERIVEILPFFAEYPPATEHTAPHDVHYEVTVTEDACGDVLAQAAAALRAFAAAAQSGGGIDEGGWPGLPSALGQAVRALASPGDPRQVMPATRAFADAARGVGLDRVAGWPELLASYRMALDALSCCDMRLRLPQAAPGAPPPPCLVAPGDAVRPPIGSRVEAVADILWEHPRWPIQIPPGTRGTVTHADGDGTLRVRWHEFEWPRFPLPLPGEKRRRGYEVRSFPLAAEQYGLVRVLDNVFVVPAAMLEAVGAPEEVSGCAREAVECLLGKFRCLSFSSAFSLCPSPHWLTHRLCVSCGARLDLRGFRFSASVIALLDRLISQSDGMRRKLTEKFSEDFAKSKLDASYLKSVRLWRGFAAADSIIVSGDTLCAEWRVPNVRPLPQPPPPRCAELAPCSIRARGFPDAAALSEALSAAAPAPAQTALIESSAGEVAADVLANMRCCADFGVRGGGGFVSFSWGLRSSYDIEGFGLAFASMVVGELRRLLQCNRFAVRRMLEAAKEGLYGSRAAVGYPPRLGELWDASCAPPGAPRPLSVSDLLGPWLDPSLTGSRKWSLAAPAEGSQVAGLLVEPDLGAAGKTLSRVRLRAGTAPAGSDLFVRLENIDTGQRADAYLRVGETDRTSHFAVPFLPGERMSGVVLLSDSAFAAANVDVEVWFDEGGGGNSAVVYALPGLAEGEHFVGQAPLDPSGGEMTLTTLCVELSARSSADFTLRALNLDTEASADAAVPAGAMSASVPVSLHFAPTDRLSIRVLAAADSPPLVSVTGIGRVGGAPEEVQPPRTVLRESGPPAAGGELLRTEALQNAQEVKLVRVSASAPPSGRPVIVTVQNLSTARFVSAELAVGEGASETAVSLELKAGEAMGASVAQADDGMVSQAVSYPAEPVSTAPPPLHDTMRLYDEDSSGVTSEVVEASVVLESPPRGSSLTVRFEDVDTGEWQDITVPPERRSASGPVGLILPEGGRLRVTLLRSGFGAAGLGVRWSRRMPPASGLRVGVVSEVRPPTPSADARSCGLRDGLEEFVRRECAGAVEPDEFALRLGREFGWPFASRLATEGLAVWGVVSGENLERVVAGDITLRAEWRHDDLTPEFLASLPSPRCPEEPEPAQPCPLEAKLLDGLDAEVVEAVAASLVASLKSLRLELRNLGGDDGRGLVVCVRTGEDICFLNSRPNVVLAILDRFGGLIQGDRRDALRKAVEHANDVRERVRVPSPPDPLSGLGRPARKLDHPRLPEGYLLSALLSRDPLLTTEGGETSFVFFGGGRDAMGDYLRNLNA